MMTDEFISNKATILKTLKNNLLKGSLSNNVKPKIRGQPKLVIHTIFSNYQFDLTCKKKRLKSHLRPLEWRPCWFWVPYLSGIRRPPHLSAARSLSSGPSRPRALGGGRWTWRLPCMWRCGTSGYGGPFFSSTIPG